MGCVVLMKHKIGFLGMSLVVDLLLSGCTQAQQAKKISHHQVVKLAIRDRAVTLDTAKLEDANGSQIAQNVYEGLYRLDKAGYLVLAGAKSEEKSSDKRVLTYHLKKNHWSNGDLVTAKDYVIAWQRAVNKTSGNSWNSLKILQNASAVHSGLLPLSSLGVKALDDLTLQVTLVKPVSYYQQVFTSTVAMPQNYRLVQRYGTKYGTKAEYTAFNGPFKLNHWTPQAKQWTLVKNQNYWGHKSVKLKKAKYYTDEKTANVVKDFKKGKYDYVRVGTLYNSRYKKDADFNEHLIPQIIVLNFNPQRKVTANRHFRLAVTYALDRRQLVKKQLKSGQALYGLIPQNYSYNLSNDLCFRKEYGNLVGYKPKLARKYLKLAQQELGQKKITLTMLATNTSESQLVAQKVAKQLKQVLPDVTLKVKAVSLAQKIKQADAYQYDMVYLSWQPDFVDLSSFFNYGGMLHLSDYQNQTYWQLVEQVQTMQASAKCRQMYAKAEKILIAQDAFVVPVFQSTEGYFITKGVKGITFSPYATTYYLRYVDAK